MRFQLDEASRHPHRLRQPERWHPRRSTRSRGIAGRNQTAEGWDMRPTVTTKHRELADKISADVDAFLSRGGKPTEHRPDERARPPVDHWDDRVSEDYKAYQHAKRAKQ